MRKIYLLIATLCSLTLGGCTGDNMKEGILKLCGFRAKNEDVIKLATKVGGALIPGAVFAVETAETVVSGVCKAYNEKKASGKESAIKAVVVDGVLIRRE